MPNSGGVAILAISIILTAEDEIVPALKSANSDKIVEVSEKYTNQFKALERQDEKLQGFRERSVRLHESIGTFVSELNEAVEKKDDEALKAAIADQEEVMNKERSLLEEVSQYCGAK
jgi:phage host-nuclease inhibitor protein Gam